MKTRIQKITSKGQVTLPIAWRRLTDTDTITLEVDGDRLIISPARLKVESEEYTVFDALRDNDGVGIPAKELAKLLRQMK